MRRRKRIQRAPREKVAVIIANEYNITYERAAKLYISAKKYCEVFNDVTILQKVEQMVLK